MKKILTGGHEVNEGHEMRKRKESSMPNSTSSPSSPSCPPVQNSVVSRIAKKLDRRRRENQPPEIASFADFLLHHARVKSDSGYVPYHFTGREALRPIVERLDQILSSGETDASLAICGGAQFGKTVLMLNLLAYLVAVRFRNVGYYLPDDDLVSGLVDGKLRPDVLDQIPWLARLIAVGKTLNASGRAVNRKGAFLCTDGRRTALAFMRGLGKIPTSFSMDVVVQDEKDDLPEENARFLAGRMTASSLRLTLLIGTQRYHGAGQNLAFTEGTQHIGLLTCPGCQKRHNPETQWPGICRLVMEDVPPRSWPKLTVEGNFKVEGRSVKEEGLQTSESTLLPSTFTLLPYSPDQHYALCCSDCGALLDRDNPTWHAQAPEREKLRRWSYRLSQLLIPAIGLEQIVAAWQHAVRDPDHMTVFCTDRLALPKSTTQTLTPGVLEQARGDYTLEVRSGERVRPSPFSLHTPSFARYAGLDMGDQCWFVARAVDVRPPHNVRLLWIEPIAAERVRTRVPELFRELDLTALCVDAGPLRDLSRDLVFTLNEAVARAGSARVGAAAPISPSAEAEMLRSASHPRWASAGYPATAWHDASQKWRHVRAMAVEFTQREGAGLRQKRAETQEGRVYPLLAANRDETIERVVRELLPPGVGDPRLLENPDGTAAQIPTQRFSLPTATDATRNVLDLYERHLLSGARQERSSDGKALRYLDKCENHFLLATAYAALAELIAPLGGDPVPFVPMFRPLPVMGGYSRPERGLDG
jgi:Phage terminase large subunit (GpA)